MRGAATGQKTLKEQLRADDAAGDRSDRSTEQEAAHTGIVAVTAITFDVRAEESAAKESADAAGNGAGNDAFSSIVNELLIGCSWMLVKAGRGGLPAGAPAFLS